jgi:hypothetical protein
MVLGQPGSQKVETTAAAVGPYVLTPPVPIGHQAVEAQPPHDFWVWSVFQEPYSGPIRIQTPKGLFSIQQCLELGLVNIVIPNVS